MAGLTKRRADVPQEALALAEDVSKAELLEVAWSFASLCNFGEGHGDDAATMSRLYEELNTLRENRRAKPLPPLDVLRVKWAKLETARKAMVERWKR